MKTLRLVRCDEISSKSQKHPSLEKDDCIKELEVQPIRPSNCGQSRKQNREGMKPKRVSLEIADRLAQTGDSASPSFALRSVRPAKL